MSSEAIVYREQQALAKARKVLVESLEVSLAQETEDVREYDFGDIIHILSGLDHVHNMLLRRYVRHNGKRREAD